MTKKIAKPKKPTVNEETEAAASIHAKPTEFSSKAALMAQGYAAMQAMDKSQLEDILAQIGHEADGVPDGASAANQGSIQPKGDPKTAITSAMKEDFEELFGGHELSEDFKGKAHTIIEAVLNARAIAIEEQIRQEHEAKLEERVAESAESIMENVDRYLTYVAEQFVEKNQLSIDTSLRTELGESLLDALAQRCLPCGDIGERFHHALDVGFGHVTHRSLLLLGSGGDGSVRAS